MDWARLGAVLIVVYTLQCLAAVNAKECSFPSSLVYDKCFNSSILH